MWLNRMMDTLHRNVSNIRLLDKFSKIHYRIVLQNAHYVRLHVLVQHYISAFQTVKFKMTYWDMGQYHCS
jgi:hypothetical protein